MRHLPSVQWDDVRGRPVEVPCDCPRCLQRGLALALFVIVAGCASGVALILWAVQL
jgi:hypothetical protein